MWAFLQALLAQQAEREPIILYLNPLKVLPVVGLYLLWVYTIAWADRENRDHRLLYQQRTFWNMVLFFPFFVLLLAWLGIVIVAGVTGRAVPASPLRPLGGWVAWGIYLVLLLGAYGIPTWVYISVRNRHVPMDDAVTLETIWRDLLIRLGFRVRPRKKQRVGPPIHFSTARGERLDQPQPLGGVEVSSPEEATALVDAWVATKEVVYDAIRRRATDVYLEPRKDLLAVIFKIDGVLMALPGLDAVVGEGVLRNLKAVAGLDPNEKRKPQKGQFVAHVRQQEIPVWVDTRGTLQGERMHLQIFSEQTVVERLEELGMRPEAVQQLKQLVQRDSGLILVGAPPEAGRTTTAHALVRAIDRFLRSVATLEDELEYDLQTVTRHTVDPSKGETPYVRLRSILRTEPDVILVDAIHDADVAQLVAETAEDRLVIATLHANDVASTIVRFRELVGDPGLAGRHLLAVISQRLVRKLCDQCKQPYRPNPQLLQRYNLPIGRIQYFYRPPDPPEKPEEVCQKCVGLGYYGRTGVFEILIANDAVREAIVRQAPLQVLKAEARKAGMIYLQEDALRQVALGMTSIQEIKRALSEPAAAAR
jgi:general secretion pathway protein E